METSAVRHFVGLCHCPAESALFGALVRVWGRGLQASVDVMAGARCLHPRLASVPRETAAAGSSSHVAASTGRTDATELAELAAQLVAPLVQRLAADSSSLRAAGLLDFGRWDIDRFSRAFLPGVDVTLLAKLTGLTVIDDFPARDLVYGGRGGPCEAVGAWLWLADRGIVPGRRIRVLVDIDRTLRLFLLPPRSGLQLPQQLTCYELGPAVALLDAVARRSTRGPRRFDARENLSVQGCCWPELLAGWRNDLEAPSGAWTPDGADAAAWLSVIDRLLGNRHEKRLADLLCSSIHWVAEQIRECVRERLPPSLPAGQLILAGPLSRHAFLVKRIRTELPERDVVALDDQVAATGCWRAVAAAVLAMLHVDQVAMNSASLTGTDSPRVLGRLTPGSPANWHRVLADLAATLPDKVALRNAV
jgi:1,6-anhydro-N-acetylmuramate kinase